MHMSDSEHEDEQPRQMGTLGELQTHEDNLFNYHDRSSHSSSDDGSSAHREHGMGSTLAGQLGQLPEQQEQSPTIGQQSYQKVGKNEVDSQPVRQTQEQKNNESALDLIKEESQSSKNFEQISIDPQKNGNEEFVQASNLNEEKQSVPDPQKQQNTKQQSISQQPVTQKPQETSIPQNKLEIIEVKNPKEVQKTQKQQKKEQRSIEKEIIKNGNQADSPAVIEQVKKEKIQEKKEYDKELDDDMEMLKKQLGLKKKKTSKKEKDIEKARLNKTVVPGKRNDFHEEGEVTELKMIAKVAYEKKKQNYQMLRAWDKKRAEKLALHRNLIEMLQSEVDKRIKSSIENIEIYQTFFVQKVRQEEKYVSQPIINTRYALQNNSLSKNVYINCSIILNSLSDENQARCRKINDFIQLIKNDILKDRIESHLSATQRQLLRSREKISTLKSALRKHNQQTEQKTNQLALFFNENPANVKIQNQKDFYSAQIDFLGKAAKQTLVQKKLGEYCLEYYNISLNEEIKRSKIIKEAMLTFTKGLSQCYNIDTDPAQVEQLSKQQETKLISQFYSLEQIFQDRLLSVFKAELKVSNHDELSMKMFEDYLTQFDFDGFDSRLIMLKQFNVRHIPISKHQVAKEENCLLVITVDRFIHLFMSKEKTDPYVKPDLTVRADQKNLQFKSLKTNGVDLIVKDQKRGSMLSYFWESKNDKTYRLQFPKRDAREQFLDYVAKIKA